VACGQEALNGEIATISEAITRTRSRIVQSPDRIKRTITTMNSAAIEDKKTVTMHEAKARELQGKINAILAIEKVRRSLTDCNVLRLTASKDIRGCVEQLQTIEKEVRALILSQKELADLRDHLDDKGIERNELKLRREVG
jgi:kinetochore protein Nuf2